MIKVQVPELRAEDVERVRRSMAALVATVRTMAPIWATLALQMAQTAHVAARTTRTALADEMRRREEASRGR